MAIYLVRMQKNKEIVGIFVGANPDDLADLVDECTDPHECEYITLGRGGIHWPKPGMPTVPLLLDAEAVGLDDEEMDDLEVMDQDDPFKFSESAFTDEWHEVFFHGPERKKWKAVPHSPVCDAINKMHAAGKRLQ